MKRGAVSTSQISLGYKSKRPQGFNVTFADGYTLHHEGGCATIPLELIEQHGRVQKAEVFF